MQADISVHSMSLRFLPNIRNSVLEKEVVQEQIRGPVKGPVTSTTAIVEAVVFQMITGQD